CSKGSSVENSGVDNMRFLRFVEKADGAIVVNDDVKGYINNDQRNKQIEIKTNLVALMKKVIKAERKIHQDLMIDDKVDKDGTKYNLETVTTRKDGTDKGIMNGIKTVNSVGCYYQ
ncbi:8040_t:CDS:2, partial [Gigaspora margarita]